MESHDDKEWARKYLLDPLTAPEPSQETGPGSHFTRPSDIYPTPPPSASPTRSSFHPSNPFSSPHRREAFADYAGERSSRRSSGDRKSLDASQPSPERRRGNSLKEKYPGDMSHQPLDLLRKETKAANRAPHLKKKHFVGADQIDRLDDAAPGVPYHHEGPYDATLLARNTSFRSSPVEAVRWSNEQALKATPSENVRDALEKHVPLQGTAVIPPGAISYDGRPLNYEEGEDLNRDTDAQRGFYRDFENAKYNPTNFMRGPPSKHHHSHRRIVSDGHSAYEMQTRPAIGTRQRSRSLLHEHEFSKATGNNMSYSEFETSMKRSNTTGRKISEGLRSRFGSLRKGKKTSTAGI